MEPAPVVMPPSELEGSAGISAMTFAVAGSMRVRTFLPQLGDQMEPKPSVRPEQGRSMSAISPGLFVVASSWTTWLARELATHVAVFVMTDQSGEPSTGKMATG